MPAPAAPFAGLEAVLSERRVAVDEALQRLAPRGRAGSVTAALEYSLFAPAKRLRPVLALLVADVLRGDPARALPGGCALEMVHTASLILDDLPAMDDARMRRGRPACHIVHGEAAAILAAFALLNRAFEIFAVGWTGGPEAALRAELATAVAAAIGLDGMIAGQAVDLETTNRALDFETLEFIHSRKTGALFMACAEVGAAAARTSAPERAALAAYAKNLGLAFQVVDDLLDVTGEAQEAGKDLGQDAKKTTFVSFSGVEGAMQLAEELVETSVTAIAGFGARGAPLRELARYVVARKR